MLDKLRSMFVISLQFWPEVGVPLISGVLINDKTTNQRIEPYL
jgi:hypothetical protein